MLLMNQAQRVLNNVDEVDASYAVVDMIKIQQLQDFTISMINTFGTAEKLKEANQVGDIVVQMLMNKNLINSHAQQSFVDILISATMMHNLFYDPSDFTTLFLARKTLTPFCEEAEIPQQVQDALFQTIESQLGEKTPVPLCKPAPNSPTELLALAIWFIKDYKPQV